VTNFGPRILLIGGTYRALCILERLLERGDRVVAFIGIEGGGERDFCPEILEICDRASIPARSGHKLGEEIVRWLEDRIRPELAIALGVNTEIPLAVGGNCRLGLLEAVDFFSSESCPGVALRQRGRDLITHELGSEADDDDVGEVYLRMIDELGDCIEEYLDELRPAIPDVAVSIPFHSGASPEKALDDIVTRAEPGANTQRLEEAVAEYIGAERVFALRSAADGFRLLLAMLDFGEDDEVICPGLISAAATEGLQQTRAKPVFVDVDGERLTLDPERALEGCGARTRGMLISHPLGQPAELDRLYGLAEERSLEVIEDGGDGLGARFGDSRLGRSPCACVFRMPLCNGTSGLQAALVTLPQSLAERFEPLVGELRLGDGGAEVALQELEGWEDRIAERRAVASAYSAELVRYDAFRVPPTPEDGLSTYAGYLLRLTRFARSSADDLQKLLLEGGIETRRLHLPLAEHPLASLPWTDNALTTGLLLPIGSGITDACRERLLDAIFGYAIG
jgi:dTDP-4-amino-4,6-dideoxygalactose transaminase